MAGHGRLTLDAVALFILLAGGALSTITHADFLFEGFVWTRASFSFFQSLSVRALRFCCFILKG
jgi:hypothetical protein